ncbi:MAG: trimeric intracellular cation channel family protein [Clostridia bacterium]
MWAGVLDIQGMIFILEIIGTVAFALSGVMIAIKKELDILGVVVVGTVTAVGGGAVRDILLGKLPPTLFVKPVYALVAIGTSLVAFLIACRSGHSFLNRIERFNPIINVFDAVGLGIFAVVGVNAAIQANLSHNAFLSIFLGTITGVGGGLMRDQLVGDIPMVLKKRVYALAALIGSSVFYLLHQLRFLDVVSLSSGVGCVILIRLLASHYKWNLPRIHLTESSES